MTAPFAPLALSFAAARERVLAAALPLAPETRPVFQCAGRALRQRIVAPHALPPFRASAMDGWAVRAADLAHAAPGAPARLDVVATIAAGAPGEAGLASGQAARIMTGGVLPPGADAVVPFEQGEDAEGGTRVRVAHAVREGEHVREAGNDVPPGEVVLGEGHELTPPDIALLVALGITAVAVGPRPRVAVLSTGDELLDPGEPLRPGTIRDSNLPMLVLLAEAAGAEVALAERLPDDARRVAGRIEHATALADVVFTTGGVSAGDFDPVRDALRDAPGLEHWRVAMRPGRPQVFGRVGGRLFHGLPGNPASSMCVFETLARPALRRLQGFAALDRPRVPVNVAAEVVSREGRTDVVRCTLVWRDGRLWASPAGSQDSGRLRPQSLAHALLIVPEAVPALAVGDRAEALVLRLPADG